jgi:three-Cys-motif partner protein
MVVCDHVDPAVQLHTTRVLLSGPDERKERTSVPIDGPVPWDRDPHTAAKHDLLRRYLAAWFPILLQGGHRSLTYAEGFAGPGIYNGEYPGSPVIALQVLRDRPDWVDLARAVRYVLIDDDPRCIRLLQETAAAAWRDRPGKVGVHIQRGRCAEQFTPQIARHGGWGKPMLAVFDSWGTAVPATLLRRIAANPASEVLVTFGSNYFQRFVETLDPVVDEVFGSSDWRQVTTAEPGEKRRYLLNSYRATLAAAGFRFILDFDLVTAQGQSLYLVFGTTHRRGLVKMKDAMWQVDRSYGVGYRDPRDEAQQVVARGVGLSPGLSVSH